MFYTALVVNNIDPTISGIIDVYVPSIMTKQQRNVSKVEQREVKNKFKILNSDIDTKSLDTVKVNSYHTIPAYPFNFIEQNTGTFLVPDIGNEVFIFFKDDNKNVAYYMIGNSYKKAKVLDYGKIIEDDKNSKNPEKAIDHRVLLLTKKGHILCFNDTEESNGILLKASNKHKLKLEDNSSFDGISLETHKGNKFLLDDSNEGIIIKSNKGHYITIDDKNNGININTSNGLRLTLDDRKQIIQLVTANGIGLEFDDKNNKLRIDSQSTDITTKTDCSIKSTLNIKQEAKLAIDQSSTTHKIDAKASVDIKGAQVKVDATATLSISSNAAITVKAPIVNIDSQKISLGGASAVSPLVKGAI